MKSLKCPSCGANINEHINTCPYCETTFINNESKPTSTVEPKVETTSEQLPAYIHGERPKINVLLLIFLLMLEVFPGIFYLLIVKSKQIEWDKHNKK